MRICVLGLDGAAPELIFADERLVNLRRLMDLGLYGSLQSVVPPTAVPAWMCMSASQDPGSLGIYGRHNRSDRSYGPLAIANSASIEALTIWDQLAREGKKAIIVGVPPNYPPKPVNGISVGCCLTPDTVADAFTYPAELKARIKELVGEYPADVKSFHSGRKDGLKEEIFEMSRKQWQVVQWLIAEQPWDYFHFVDIGLNRIQRGFWSFCDPQHPSFEPGNPYQDVVPEYYRWLDEQIGSALELLDDETILLVMSASGTQRLEGEIAVNEWLIRENLLVLNKYPEAPTPLENLSVNWHRTKAWAEGGCCAQVFFNLQGREPQGVVPASEYEKFRNELKAQLETIPGPDGRPLDSQVSAPQEIYREARNIPPDLVACIGGLRWRAVGTVGHGEICVQGKVASLEGNNCAPYGMFVLTAPNCPLAGQYEGAHLLDMAPTLLDLAGFEIPKTMQGRSLVAGMEKKSSGGGSRAESERIVHDRLAGLGYV